MIKQQYGFDILNTRTGGCRCKSFWGFGDNEEACKADALRQARAYAEQLTEKDYQKAKMRNRSGYAPSRSSYQYEVVGNTCWR